MINNNDNNNYNNNNDNNNDNNHLYFTRVTQSIQDLNFEFPVSP